MSSRQGYQSEAELGTAVLGWLSQMGWDVFPEVTSRGGDERADLVAVCGPLLWVVECKMAFGLPVLAQADRWRGRAHYVSIAVPGMPKGDAAGFGRDVARERGIGVIVAHPPRWDGDRPDWRVQAPALNRRAAVGHLRGLLHVGQKAFTAGAQSGFYTPYQGTCRALRELLDSRPEGMPVKEAIDALKGQHHYSTDATARASLSKWVRWGHVPGVALVEGKPPRFVRKETAKT